MQSNPKLTIELVPSTSFYNNVRTNVSSERWDSLRKNSYKRANYKCEICGESGLDQGFKHPVECHEIWTFDLKFKVQKLEGLITLCPLCHTVKHIGLASINNKLSVATNHLMRINNWSNVYAEKYITDCFNLWEFRSKFNWTLDISILKTI